MSNLCAELDADLTAVQDVYVVYWHGCLKVCDEKSSIQSLSVQIVER